MEEAKQTKKKSYGFGFEYCDMPNLQYGEGLNKRMWVSKCEANETLKIAPIIGQI